MAVAVIYKFVLALTGIGIILFWGVLLRGYLKGYYWMYFLELFLNIAVVSVLLLVMLDIILLQASIYIAVDILPVPGAQGIMEAMYNDNNILTTIIFRARKMACPTQLPL